MKEIKQRLGGTVKPMTVHNAVSYLARKGCLTRIGWGKFRLNA
jgi:predicted transcriptional regulator of viral defense system